MVERMLKLAVSIEKVKSWRVGGLIPNSSPLWTKTRQQSPKLPLPYPPPPFSLLPPPLYISPSPSIFPGSQPFHMVNILLLVFSFLNEFCGRAAAVWRQRILQRLVVSTCHQCCVVFIYCVHTSNEACTQTILPHVVTL